MKFNDTAPALSGQLTLHIYRNGEEVERWSDHNAIMPDAYSVLAHLLLGEAGFAAAYVGVSGGSSENPNQENIAAMRINSVPVVGAVPEGSPNKVRFSFNLDRDTCNNIQIQEFGLFCGESKILFAHRVRSSTIVKTDDLEIAGTWTITFASPSTEASAQE